MPCSSDTRRCMSQKGSTTRLTPSSTGPTLTSRSIYGVLRSSWLKRRPGSPWRGNSARSGLTTAGRWTNRRERRPLSRGSRKSEWPGGEIPLSLAATRARGERSDGDRVTQSTVAATQVAGGAQRAEPSRRDLLKRSPVLVERGGDRGGGDVGGRVGTSVISQNGMRMKLRLFPQSKPVYFDLLEAAADNLTRAAETLLELATDLTDVKDKADRLMGLEQEADRITRQMVTRLHSAFLAHLDPDELYALAVGFNDVVDAIEDAGDMLWAHQVTEPFRL